MWLPELIHNVYKLSGGESGRTKSTAKAWGV